MKNEVKDIDNPLYRITPLQQAAASCSGALITSFFVTPLDVVKIRLQAQQSTKGKCFLYCNGLMDHICGCNDNFHKSWYEKTPHFNGTIDAFVKISRREGIWSLWSGLGPTLVLAVPSTIIYFVTYEQLRLKLKDLYNGKRDFTKRVQPFWIPLLAGATARIFSVTLVSPLELIRTKMQSKKLSYLEIGDGLKILIQQDGIKGLWKGIFPTLMRDVPFSAIYWCSYETLKKVNTNNDFNNPSLLVSFLAGAISGSIAATATVPFDVIKTNQQIEFGETLYYGEKSKKERTSLQICNQIYRQYGVKGLFAGLVPRLIKVAPACAIMISSFEYSKVFFHRLANESDNYSINVKQTKPGYCN